MDGTFIATYSDGEVIVGGSEDVGSAVVSLIAGSELICETGNPPGAVRPTPVVLSPLRKWGWQTPGTPEAVDPFGEEHLVGDESVELPLFLNADQIEDPHPSHGRSRDECNERHKQSLG